MICFGAVHEETKLNADRVTQALSGKVSMEVVVRFKDRADVGDMWDHMKRKTPISRHEEMRNLLRKCGWNERLLV
jgi:hypothetical protein